MRWLPLLVLLLAGCAPESAPQVSQNLPAAAAVAQPLMLPVSHPVKSPTPEQAQPEWRLLYEDTVEGGETFHFTSSSEYCVIVWDCKVIKPEGSYRSRYPLRIWKDRENPPSRDELVKGGKGQHKLNGMKEIVFQFPTDTAFEFAAYDLVSGDINKARPPAITLRDEVLKAFQRKQGERMVFYGDDVIPSNTTLVSTGWECTTCGIVKPKDQWGPPGKQCRECGGNASFRTIVKRKKASG